MLDHYYHQTVMQHSLLLLMVVLVLLVLLMVLMVEVDHYQPHQPLVVVWAVGAVVVGVQALRHCYQHHH